MVAISKKEAFCLIYDYLKKSRIVREFVEASYEYHKREGHNTGAIRPYGRENTKKIISSNIEAFSRVTGTWSGFMHIFMSFSGSFDWSHSKLGSDFWRKYLEDGWYNYLRNKFKDEEIYLVK